MKIPPSYTLTAEIVDLLTKIEANRIFLNSTEIPTPVKSRIQRMSLLKSSLYSARIEGNPLTLDDVEYSSDTIKKREVENILQAIQLIDSIVKPQTRITPEFLRILHRQVMDGLGPDAGKWRREVSGIFNQAGVAVYMPPPPSQIRELIARLLEYVNSDKEANAVICALVSHLIFEKIHPFLDGNGRVGRLLIYAICKTRKWVFPMMVPVEEYVDEHKEGYYYYLDVGLKETEVYLKFMLEAFWESTESLKAEITASSSDKTLLLISPRQEEIYHIIKNHRIVSFDSIRRRFLKVPERTLRYDLKKLQDKKLLLKIGRTRGTYYRVKGE